MELWIRSQDKTTLMKVDRLDIDYSNSIYLIKADGFGTLLATYNSEQRALEVLDEIQGHMQKSVFVKKVNGLGEELDLIPNSIFIYTMPEE